MTKKIARHWQIGLFSFISLAFVVGGFFWAYGKLSGENMVWNGGAGPFILHFDNINGITATGNFGQIVLMGVLGAIMVILNFLVAMALEERDHIIARVMTGATLLMAVLLFLSFIAILNVN